MPKFLKLCIKIYLLTYPYLDCNIFTMFLTLFTQIFFMSLLLLWITFFSRGNSFIQVFKVGHKIAFSGETPVLEIW